MNKFGVSINFWEDSWKCDVRAGIDKARMSGINLLEISASNIETLTSEERIALKEYADAANVELVYSFSIPEEYDIAADDENVRKRGIEYAKEIIKKVGEMGGEVLCGITYGSWKYFPYDIETRYDELYRRHIESMKEIMETAEYCGIDYCMEIVNRFDGYLLNTTRQALDFIEQVGSPGLKIHLDTFHMGIEESSFREAIVAAGEKLGHFHAGDSAHNFPGQGIFPWEEICMALKEINYNGRIVLEPFVKKGGSFGESLSIWRNVDPGSDEILQQKLIQSIDYLKNKLN